MIALLLVLGLAQPSALRQAEAAVQAEPDRPGLRLAWAHQLLRAGDADGAEREAQRVLARWPKALRPHLVLAGVAVRRGRLAEATAALRRVADEAPPPVARMAAEALRRLGRTGGEGWGARGWVGAAWDSHAVPAVDALDPQGTASARLVVGAGADWRRARGPWRLGLAGAVDRTGHLAQAAADQDRTLLRLEARLARALGPGDLALRLEGRGGLAGRWGEPHHLGGGAGLWYGARPSRLSPWIEARGLGFWLPQAQGGQAWLGEIAAGATTHARRWRATARLAALRVDHPRGGDELGADAQVELLLGPAVVSALGGVGARDGLDALRPRARLDGRWRIDGTWSLLGHGAWLSAGDWDRWVAGLTVEVSR
ncbi:MAG: tetratricopeptide repeat protein [Myxococcales bacterium]|nr:tetratricopeptide repeat protein [Myxococcales bacterium]